MRFLKTTVVLNFLVSLLFANDKDIEAIFKQTGVEGTVVISSLNSKKTYVYDKQRANYRYIPASTFKILNTLIALDQEVIKDENELIKWDGVKRFYPPWNKDQTLKSAISISCVWCYQRFAKDIGNENYLKYLSSVKYGNQKTGLELTTFWLDGDLKISTFEQIEFLQKLYNDKLPFRQKHLDITKNILTVEKTDDYIIKAKSGWSQKIGWYVGYVETKNQVWFFALNANIDKKQLKYRKEIIIKALKAKNII